MSYVVLGGVGVHSVVDVVLYVGDGLFVCFFVCGVVYFFVC